MAIPQTFIQELLARADVVEVVGRHVQLKKGGANFSGLCPFHAEKSPSFTVSPTKQFYHCFGCGKSGDAIRFLMEHTGSTFVEAVQDLAQQFGMQVPEDEASPQDRARAAAQREKQNTLSGVLEKAGEAWRKQLKSSPRAVAYFKGRGVSGEIARHFGLGYAPEGWRSLASVFPDYDDPLLAESGLVIVNEEDDKRYDRFRDRVMFPIRNIKGECIGFGGRVLGDEKPKYLNSPETPVFSKGRELYGLFEARNALRDQGYVLVTEGYMDVVALAQLGFPNAVATLGTACTPDHVQKLFRFTDSVVFSFDGDAAGRRAARKALDGALGYATDVRSVKFLFLPPEHDPDSFIRENGREAFAAYVGNATPLSRFLIEAAQEGCDMNTAEGRAHMAANAKPLWTQLPEGALKRQLLGEIADEVKLDSRELQDMWEGRPPSRGGGDGEGRERREGGQRARRQGNWGSRPGGGSRIAGRVLPVSRASRALQILFSDSAQWDGLGNDDHHMLCELPAPHGPLFAWLDGQQQDHGPQPWGMLREALRGHGQEQFAVDELAKVPPEIQADPAELKSILSKERDARRAEEMSALAEAAASDPEALRRYNELLQARKTSAAG
ncbi:MAG: DNA primase [Burkholderiaceae bacterium]